MTVESCISFSFFVCLFLLLLFFAKLICIHLVLDQAVGEAAKQLAASAYPLSMLNENEDDLLEKYSLTVDSESDAAAAAVLREYWGIKAAGERKIAEAILDGLIQEGFINKNKIRFHFIALPKSEMEFKTLDATEVYNICGLLPDKDFTKADVVLQVSYDSGIKLPYFNFSNISLFSTAVEKAWQSGGNGVITNREEGLNLAGGAIVYVTRTGCKYHLDTCRYLRKSKIPISLDKARASGYEACKICKPDFQSGP